MGPISTRKPQYKAHPILDLLAQELGRGLPSPLYRQIYEMLRGHITTGRLRAGARLPATRTLATSLGLSRNTVTSAIGQLMTEGYLEGKQGSGTYVSQLPADMITPMQWPARSQTKNMEEDARLRARFTRFTEVPAWFRSPLRSVPFCTNAPAIDAFPIKTWGRITTTLLRRIGGDPRHGLLGEGDALGYRPLREIIARDLALSRGVQCSADNVVICNGAQQALDIALRILTLPGDGIWCEDPGYPGVAGAVRAAGAVIHPIPVDEDGIDVERGLRMAPQARVACVCPSKQFPLGGLLTLQRRMRLLEWAAATEAWIIEDDYDHDFRLRGPAIPALQALDRAGRVIYIGTFSKSLFPALRVGYAVLPTSLIDAFGGARAVMGRHSSVFEQAQIAEFIREGHFASHMRRMRKLYSARQDVLLASAERHLRGLLRVVPTQAGMNCVAWIEGGRDVLAVESLGVSMNLELFSLSRTTLNRSLPPGLLLGFSAFSPEQIEAGIVKLGEVMRRTHPKPPVSGARRKRVSN
jgi:GntR family transcriptional regulator / MocR family aminotransferase